MRKTLLVAGILLCGVSHGSASLHGITVRLPDTVQWTKAHEVDDGEQYVREWIPSGKSLKDTDWLIVEQKLALQRRTSSKQFLTTTMQRASSACEDVKFNGPEKVMLGDRKAFTGRIMCSHQIGKAYGSFTELLVLVEDKTVYVITSAVRTPPSPVAGVLMFERGQEEDEKDSELMKRVEASAEFVRTAVTLCEEPECK